MVYLFLMNFILKLFVGYEIKWGENWKYLYIEIYDWFKYKYMYK